LLNSRRQASQPKYLFTGLGISLAGRWHAVPFDYMVNGAYGQRGGSLKNFAASLSVASEFQHMDALATDKFDLPAALDFWSFIAAVLGTVFSQDHALGPLAINSAPNPSWPPQFSATSTSTSSAQWHRALTHLSLCIVHLCIFISYMMV